MSIAAKVYNKIIFNRLMPVVDKILRRNQAGFRKGRSCIQQIHILRRIIEGATEKGIPFFITFIDFKKAFDSICRKTMFAILRHIGIPDQIVQAIKVLYDDSKSRVFVDGQYSKEFKVNTGVLQGDVLAPSLFIIVIDFVMRQSEKEFGIVTHPRQSSRHPAKRLNDLDYADDIALLETNLERAHEQLKTTSENAKKVGLEINVEKTKIMIMNTFDVQNALRLNDASSDYVEQVRDFKYLGSMMASGETDLKNRKGQAWGAFWKLTNIWFSKSTPFKLKFRIFQASCVSILLYGSETWILSEKIRKSLDSFATNCYRIMLGIKHTDRISNEEVYKRTGQIPLSDKVIRRQLTWIGHMLRRETDEPIRIYGLYEPKRELGTTKRGRPAESYASYIAGLISKAVKLSSKEIEAAAQCREKWKKLGIACTGSYR